MANYYFSTSFDLWMSKGGYDIFALVINFWGLIGNQNKLQLCFFETFDTSRYALAKNLTKLFGKYDLRKKKNYVKNKGFNLNSIIIALKSIVSCDVSSLTKSF